MTIDEAWAEGVDVVFTFEDLSRVIVATPSAPAARAVADEFNRLRRQTCEMRLALNRIADAARNIEYAFREME